MDPIEFCILEQKKHPEAAAAMLVVPYTFETPS